MTGPELQQIRKYMGLSRKKLGDLLGVHWNTVNRWERDLHPIPSMAVNLLQRLQQEQREQK